VRVCQCPSIFTLFIHLQYQATFGSLSFFYFHFTKNVGADHDKATQVRLRTGRDYGHGEQKFSKVSALVILFLRHKATMERAFVNLCPYAQRPRAWVAEIEKRKEHWNRN
jgi:hypothetical protein